MKQLIKYFWLCGGAMLLWLCSTAQPNVTRVEYYIDTDPGYGLATAVSITAGTNLSNQTININPTTLATGVHLLGLRALDTKGNWSLNQRWLFIKPSTTNEVPPGPVPNITRAEYYIDTDPGYGLATAVSITAGTNIANQTFNISPSTLTQGVHLLGIRALDANGGWSLNQRWLFVVPLTNFQTAPPIKTMKLVEYYIDKDPGWGKGVPVAIANNATNLTNIPISANVTGLATGIHKFFIRGMDSTNAWSLSDTLQFTIPTLLSSPAITVNSIVAKTSNCARDSFNISYDATGTYNAGNVFTVQLSDNTGSFASPTTIASYTGTGDSILKVKLPSHLSDGNYMVRVNSSNPVVTGSASSSIAIHDRPSAPAITGAANANATFSYPYSVPSVTGSTWAWISSAATIAQTTNNANITWNVAAQPDSVQVIETNQYGCVGDTGLEKVNVYTLQINNTAASSLTPCPDGTITVTGNATGVYSAGNIFTAQLSNASGSFSSPISIGTVTANPVGLSQPVSITATLPFPMANGIGYLVRIVASAPVVTGINGAQNIDVNKPNLGADTSTTISCANGTADIATLYNTTGLTAVYSATTPATASPGVYNLFVTNPNGCKDTAVITVLDASTATVPTGGSDVVIANRECTDATGWTHYYYDNGTPTDYSDDIRLLSIKKNGNNIGTVGDGTFQLKVAATVGAGTNHAVKVNSPLISSDTTFYSMNRYWNITPTTQPTSSVGVRFYYNDQDLADVNGDYPGGNITETQLSMYKLQGGNPNPTTNWAGATANQFYTNGTTTSLQTWVYTSLGNNRNQAEFLVSDFSGGGAGAVELGALPVTYVSFNVVAEPDKIELLWTTATEINSNNFEIQRSFDGTTFATIGTETAAGNSNILRNYEYDDVQGITLKGQELFYRIVETDIDGHEFYTDIKNVKIPDDGNNLKLVYNPVNNQALLRYTCVANAHVQIRVVDHLGRVISVIEQTVQQGVNDIKLETGNLARGIYEVELSSNQDQEHVRMMKE